MPSAGLASWPWSGSTRRSSGATGSPNWFGWPAAACDVGHEGRPSTGIEWSRIAEYDPEIIVLMPCGFDLERTIAEFTAAELPAEWMGLRAVRAGEVYAVNVSAYFNRPGPRIVEGLQILAEIVQPGLFRPAFAGTAWQRVGAEGPDAR